MLCLLIIVLNCVASNEDVDLRSLAGPVGFSINGAGGGDQSGVCVSVAGDVDGDGVDDLIVGANQADPVVNLASRSNAGTSYVLFGRRKSSNLAASYATINLLALNTAGSAVGFAIFGAAAGDYNGRSVSGAGDVNGDGLADVIVGSYMANLMINDQARNAAGVSYVIFGRSSYDYPFSYFTNIDLLPLNSAGSVLGFAILGAKTIDCNGYSVSGAGDVNGDGLADVIVSSHQSDVTLNGNTRSGAGIAYVLFGRNFIFGPPGYYTNIDLLPLNTAGSALGFAIFGAAATDATGASVSGAGDVNGDNVDDIIIGAYKADPVIGGNTRNNAGITYVIFGRSVGLSYNTNIDLLSISTVGSSLGFAIIGAVGSDNSGWSVGAAGDVNGDRLADIIIGAYQANVPLSGGGERSAAGIAYVLFGRGSTATNPTGYYANIDLLQLNTASSAQGFAVFGAASGDNSGQAVSYAGDVNGDGLSDVIVGAYMADPPVAGSRDGAGISYVIFGRSVAVGAAALQMNIDLATFLPTGTVQGYRIFGVASADQSGYSVSTAGDVNKDGVDDVIVGAYAVNGVGTGSGASYVIFGVSTQPTRSPSAAPSMQPTSQPSSQPSRQPVSYPSSQPSRQPTSRPSGQPTRQPLSFPSDQPTTQPSARPSRQPTAQPSSQPSTQPSSRPSCQPSRQPIGQPTAHPSNAPSTHPTAQPSARPSRQPSTQPSDQPSSQPIARPSSRPSRQPSRQPSGQPTSSPSSQPSIEPTARPSVSPSSQPSSQPSAQPSRQPLSSPSSVPSNQPSRQPTSAPSVQPSSQPVSWPSSQPTTRPSIRPSRRPISLPTNLPTEQPSVQSSAWPSAQPSGAPSGQPSSLPSAQPSVRPTSVPCIRPVLSPSAAPSCAPTSQPTHMPSNQPSRAPSFQPSTQPSVTPSSQPTLSPSGQPSGQPSYIPSSQPSTVPSSQPVSTPSEQPSIMPSSQPSGQPVLHPTSQPSAQPSSLPSSQPSQQPRAAPSGQPTAAPSARPTFAPTGEWATVVGQHLSQVVRIDHYLWTCGFESTTNGPVCALVDETTGHVVALYGFYWNSVTAALSTSITNSVVIHGRSSVDTVESSEVAICTTDLRQLHCAASSFLDTKFLAASHVSYPNKIVYVGWYNVHTSFTILDVVSGTVQSYTYTATNVKALTLSQIQSPPNFLGSFVAGTAIRATATPVNYIVAGMFRTDGGSLRGMVLMPVSGDIFNNADLVNAMALENVGPDSFIAGGLHLADVAGTHAYLLRVNALFSTVLFCVRYRSLLGDRRALTAAGEGSSVVRGMVLVDATTLFLIVDHTINNVTSLTVLKTSASDGAILKQVHVTALNSTSLHCTGVTIAGDFLSVVCGLSGPSSPFLTQSLLFLVNHGLTFSALPVGFMRSEEVVFQAESVSFKRTVLSISQTPATLASFTYEFTTVDQTPTRRPSLAPSYGPSSQPSSAPSAQPSSSPTAWPSVSARPTSQPSSAVPTITHRPTAAPTVSPSCKPSAAPTLRPSVCPTTHPSLRSTVPPNIKPSTTPSTAPTKSPTRKPSLRPSAAPSRPPTPAPSMTSTSAGSHSSDPESQSGERRSTTPPYVVGVAVGGGLMLLLVGYVMYKYNEHNREEKARQERMVEYLKQQALLAAQAAAATATCMQEEDDRDVVLYADKKRKRIASKRATRHSIHRAGDEWVSGGAYACGPVQENHTLLPPLPGTSAHSSGNSDADSESDYQISSLHSGDMSSEEYSECSEQGTYSSYLDYSDYSSGDQYTSTVHSHSQSQPQSQSQSQESRESGSWGDFSSVVYSEAQSGGSVGGSGSGSVMYSDTAGSDREPDYDMEQSHTESEREREEEREEVNSRHGSNY